MHRFYLPDPDSLVLSGEEAHHCRDVLRLRSGDEVEIFDGLGHATRCRIAEMTKRGVHLTSLERRISAPLTCHITLAAAVIKKNFDLIVQKATELGVETIVPLVTERTVVHFVGHKATRWREIALEACKQCGNNRLPNIPEPQTLKEFLAAPGLYHLKLVASLQADAQPLKEILSYPPPRIVLLLVGPEGDFTETEYAAARAAGCRPLTLGPLTLRAETAALYALSIVHHELVTHGGV
jgi:16S rRNA (uracil1498-N3)-methyltransferase